MPAALERTVAALERAIGLARRGQQAQADRLCRAAAAMFPLDCTVLHKAGVVQQLLGRNDAALDYFRRALAAVPRFPYSELEMGNTHEQAGNKHAALEWLSKAAEHPATVRLGSLRAARIARDLGQHGRALSMLQRACTVLPEDFELTREYADALVYHDRRQDAARALAGVIWSAEAAEADHVSYLGLLTELADYKGAVTHAAALAGKRSEAFAAQAAQFAAHARMAMRHDRDAVCHAAERREASAAWADLPAVLARIRLAVAARQPFSLVRFGDGEARFLLATDGGLDPSAAPEDRAEAGGSIWANWFGTRFEDANRDALARLHADTLHAMATASILAVPTADRLRRDHLHFGYLAALERQLTQLDGVVPGQVVTDSSIAALLHRADPFYGTVLAGLDRLGVISPHPGLADRLARRLGIARTVAHVVPGETRLPEFVRGATRPHFPDVFEETLAALETTAPGTVFLVAAGLLGKVYCSRIKALGGIALDIGSVADAWMGWDTRPGLFTSLDTWRLPP